MTREEMTGRLTAVRADRQRLVEQRARLAELLDETTAQLNQAQGRIAELTELIALVEEPRG